jgi:DNA-binding NarL/FixJ family response regulator
MAFRFDEPLDDPSVAAGDEGAPIRILIGDAHAMFAQGLARLLDDEPDLRAVGYARTMEATIALAEGTTPDLVLLDIELHRHASDGGIASLRNAAPLAGVLLLTTSDPHEVIPEATSAGAWGVVSKRSDIGLLVEDIHRAAAGEPPADREDPSVALRVRPERRPRQSRSGLGDDALGLTPRETEILSALASGRGTLEVAASLHISPLTVRSHVKSILSKLGVHSKLEAVTLAIRTGLIRLDRTA